MSEQQPVVRRLPDGYEVTEHPDGSVRLNPGQSRLRERLAARRPAHRAAHQELHRRHHALIERRRTSLAAHPAVPASKRCV